MSLVAEALVSQIAGSARGPGPRLRGWRAQLRGTAWGLGLQLSPGFAALDAEDRPEVGGRRRVPALYHGWEHWGRELGKVTPQWQESRLLPLGGALSSSPIDQEILGVWRKGWVTIEVRGCGHTAGAPRLQCKSGSCLGGGTWSLSWLSPVSHSCELFINEGPPKFLFYLQATQYRHLLGL